MLKSPKNMITSEHYEGRNGSDANRKIPIEQRQNDKLPNECSLRLLKDNPAYLVPR